MSSASFRKLSTKVAREYRRKGISAKTARRWGNATAGKVRARKRARRR